MKVALYVRVSTQEQAKEGYSIGEQSERLKKYADAMGWKIYKVYTDAGYSGATTERPALQDMIKDVKAGKFEKIVVYKLDRLSRSQLDTLYLIEKVFIVNNVDFVSMNENFDTSTPFGRAMIGILAVFAQLDREQIKERLAMGKEARAKEGKWHGAEKSPIGYDYINGELVVNEYYAMQIKEIFKMFTVDGIPITRIEKILNEKGYRTQYNTAWTAKQLRETFKNKLYCGYVSHKKVYYKGIHTPLIDEETYEKTQQLLAENKEKQKKLGRQIKSTAQSTYLGGIIFCGKCGARYSKRVAYTKGHGNYEYYSCYSRHKKVPTMVKDPNCMNKNYYISELDEIILGEIKKLSLDKNYFNEIKTAHHSENENIDKAKIISSKIKDIDNQISRFLDLYGQGRFTVEQLDAKVHPLEDERNKLTEELKHIEIKEPKLSEDDALELINSFSEVIERNDFNEIRNLVITLIERIIIDNDDITIYWNFV